ncbi:hypothetical protein, partial [Bifidobacterium xylocopae]|uniref:hypothetical protein n=1 Tax=Bifidobacterium xylocopae TaxID=2493119 RepID=UPI001374A21F
MIVVLALCAGGWGLSTWNARRHRQSVADCRTASLHVTRAMRSGESKRAAGARDVQAGQVADAKTVSDYQRAVKAITKVKPVSC